MIQLRYERQPRVRVDSDSDADWDKLLWFRSQDRIHEIASDAVELGLLSRGGVA